MNLTNDSLKHFAVDAVTKFASEGKPLNDSIASISEANKLSPDQVKRVVEASNQLAYLQMLKTAEDRTFEFPVADYDSIMGNLCSMDKAAEEKPFRPLDLVTRSTETQGLEKAASEEEKAFDLDRDSKLTLLWKAAGAAKMELSRLRHDEQEMISKLGSAGAAFKKDELYLNKLAQVAEEDVFNPLARFLGCEKEFGKEASFNVFRDKDLEEARRFCDLYKEAKELVARRKKLESSIEKAASVFGTVLSGLTEGASTLGGAAVGGAAGLGYAATKGLAKGVIKSTKKLPVSKLDMLAGLGYKPEHGVWDSLHVNN